MKELGVEEIRVDRSCAQLISDKVGAELPGENSWTPEMFRRLYTGVPYDKQVGRAGGLLSGSSRHGPAGGDVALLEKIHRKNRSTSRKRRSCSWTFCDAAGRAMSV